MPLIALDADGVLLDYHAAYRQAWAQAFGYLPMPRDPLAYWPLDRWDVRRLEGFELKRFRACFDDAYWESIPALPGAVRACEKLCEAGYELVCVSAIKSHFQAARQRNLRSCGFPIETVIAASTETVTTVSPKAAALSEVRPVAFVDDYLPYFRGIPEGIHAAIVLREPNGSPNMGEDLAILTHSQHADLASFVSWWLQSDR
jgi:hypothetical protein